jgi:glycine/D-amino acid oxidase-like deaminating enzyme
LVRGETTCDTVIVGAGFTGLSTALHLREAGVDVAVVEAAEPGWGASGRNNGQVIPTLTRVEPDDLVAAHGEAGERFVSLLRDSASALFDTVRAYGIEAEAEQAGWVQPVHTPGRIRIAEQRARQWNKHGASAELVSREAMSGLLGSDAWYGGLLIRSGGHINPLALARGLTDIILAKGGRIFAHSPALGYERRGSRWIVTTPQGQLTARSLVLATNAYSGEFSAALAPAIAREVVPIRSWQMATQPLTDNIRKTIIPGRQAMSDTHGELYFARYDARNRLVTGGALINPLNAAERLKPIVAARLQRLWPQIGDITFDFVWNGYVGMTADYMPRFHRLGPDAYAWAGCNGRGVGLSIAVGREIARAVQGTADRDLALPFSKPAPLPLHGVLRRLAPLMLARYRRRDVREIA